MGPTTMQIKKKSAFLPGVLVTAMKRMNPQQLYDLPLKNTARMTTFCHRLITRLFSAEVTTKDDRQEDFGLRQRRRAI